MSRKLYSGNGNRRQPTRRPNLERDRQIQARRQDPTLMQNLPDDPRLAFAEVIFRQLGPYLDTSKVRVLLDSSAADAQRLADEWNEPVALVDEKGVVLAFCTPR
jgi:hypothetical protein